MNNNIKCLVVACDELEVPYTFIDTNQNVVRLETLHGPEYFAHTKTPFNSEVVARIFSDKEYTYRLLKDYFMIPKTIGYLDPFVKEEYAKYVSFASYEAIESSIAENFALPCVIKRNRGSQGDQVFVCQTREDITQNTRTIFDRASGNYDYVVLAQEFVYIEVEYRVIVFDGGVELIYAKDTSDAVYTGNISPLHWEGAGATVLDDTMQEKAIKDFIAPLFDAISVRWVGLDVVLDRQGKLWILEGNTGFGVSIFVRDNGPERIVELYKKAVKTFFI